jgi:hypothetical protein
MLNHKNNTKIKDIYYHGKTDFIGADKFIFQSNGEIG